MDKRISNQMMNNPWHHLPDEFPFLLPSDFGPVISFNKTAEEIHKIHYELLPEPYLGKPDASIFLLNLNPGYSELDLPFYEKDSVRLLWQKNISHEHLEYPFYLLDPTIVDESGPRWWSQKLKELIQLAGRKTVANQICCVEYFPYHSRKFKANKKILESQKYSFFLVEQAIARNNVIVLMRGEKFWMNAIPGLEAYPKVFRLKSVQNVAVSRNNCPEGFVEIEKILLEQRETI